MSASKRSRTTSLLLTIISQAVHSALMSALRYPEDKKFQRFFPMDDGDFIHPADRSERYTIIEVSLFEGRSMEAKRALIQALFDNLKAQSELGDSRLERGQITGGAHPAWFIKSR